VPHRLVAVTLACAAALLAGCGVPSGASAVSPPAATFLPDASSAAARPEVGRLRLYAGTRPSVPASGLTSSRALPTATDGERTYRLFVPDGLDGRVPLVVALHGGLGSGEQFAANSGLDGLATANGFIVAYPDGVTRFLDGSGGARTWNAGKCCGPAAARDVDDVAFIRDVVADVSQLQDIDADRVYAIGHSNGGMMALRLACEASDVFAAVGVQASSLESAPCEPSTPVSSMQIHGAADTNVPLDGGAGTGLAGVAFAPPRAAAESLASADGCGSATQRVRDRANRDLVMERWRGCSPGIAVQFLTVRGAGHAWMGRPSLSEAADRLMGVPYPRLDASRALWAFVSAHPRAT